MSTVPAHEGIVRPYRHTKLYEKHYDKRLEIIKNALCALIGVCEL